MIQGIGFIFCTFCTTKFWTINVMKGKWIYFFVEHYKKIFLIFKFNVLHGISVNRCTFYNYYFHPQKFETKLFLSWMIKKWDRSKFLWITTLRYHDFILKSFILLVWSYSTIKNTYPPQPNTCPIMIIQNHLYFIGRHFSLLWIFKIKISHPFP